MGQKTNPKAFRLVTTQKHLSQWYSDKNEYALLAKEDFLIRENVNKYLSLFLNISKVEIVRSKAEKSENTYASVVITALYPREIEVSKQISAYYEKDINAQLDAEELSKLTPEELSELPPEEAAKLNLKITPEVTPEELFLLKTDLKSTFLLLLRRELRNLIRFLQIKTKIKYSFKVKFIRRLFTDSVLIAKNIGEQLERRVPFRRVVKQTIRIVRFNRQIKGIKIQVSGRLNGIDIARSEWKRSGRVPLHTLNSKIDYTHYAAETVYGSMGIKVWLYIVE